MPFGIAGPLGIVEGEHDWMKRIPMGGPLGMPASSAPQSAIGGGVLGKLANQFHQGIGKLQSDPTAQLGLRMLANSGYSPQKRGLGEIFGTSILQQQQAQQQSGEDALRRRYMEAQIGAMGRPQSEPLETIIGPDGKPVLVPRSQAAGRSPYMEPPKAPTPTDDQREYEFARLQGYKGSFFDYLREVKKAGAPSVDARQMGTIPPGFQVEYDAQGRPARMLPIPGGPAAIDAEKAARADRERRAGETRRGGIVTQDIDRALNVMEGGILPDTGVGAFLKDVPGTDAKALNSLLDTVKANIGFEELNRMRQQSPTGGALGNVTERELTYLQAVAGSLDQAQGDQQLKDNLNRLWNAYQDVIHGPGNGPPRRQLSFEPSFEDVEAEMRRRGLL